MIGRGCLNSMLMTFIFNPSFNFYTLHVIEHNKLGDQCFLSSVNEYVAR